ncbi:MAG: aldehyde dehydrogenase family protein [Planctomycetes bacterium]|nr:aldehyde dehydrogenase family protein [Planctomycetota bacterium]
MLREHYPYYLAGEPIQANDRLVVTNKYTQEPATRVAKADGPTLERGIAAAAEAFTQTRKLPSYMRQGILNHIVGRVTERHEELSQALAVEAGKPIKDARGEVTRLVDTFRIAAEESVRNYGQWQPLDISERAAGYQSIWRRFPLGPCAFITPFNFPMNLVAHKVAPAIAVGNPFVLKPASYTPIGALILGEILAETEWPKAAFSILPCAGRDADPLVSDDRIKLLSFTGSPEVGWHLRSRAPKKRVTLELGGNAACIVDRDADLDYAADRITIGAFYQSGQSCISIQRVLIHGDVYQPLKERLAARATKLKAGDPLAEDTFLGPLISEDDARRVEHWVNEAIAAGAKLVCGGKRHGVLYEATYLEHVDRRQKVNCVEVFGPVATLQPFDTFEQAVRIANDSDYGLQCGVFTKNIHHAFYSYEELDVGGVVINDMPSMRVDSMPYGGVKESGMGREGIRFAMEEQSEIKLLVLNRISELQDLV